MERDHSTRQVSAADFKRSSEHLEEAFSRHQDRLLGMLYYLVGNSEDARAAFQEAFVKCHRRLGHAPEAENLRAWIFRVALNVGRDLRSSAWRRRRRPLAEDESHPAAQPSPSAVESASQDQLELVRQALMGLRPEEKDVFLVRQDGEMTYEEIARAISIPLAAVKTRMRSALARLREALEAKG